VCRAQVVLNCAEIKPMCAGSFVLDSSEQCNTGVSVGVANRKKFGVRLSDVMCGGLKFFPQTNRRRPLFCR
jgi:hypothetical protein